MSVVLWLEHHNWKGWRGMGYPKKLQSGFLGPEQTIFGLILVEGGGDDDKPTL